VSPQPQPPPQPALREPPVLLNAAPPSRNAAGKRPVNSMPLGAPRASWHIDAQPSLAREMVREVTAAGGVKYTPLVDLETEPEIEMEAEVEMEPGAQAEAGGNSDARPPPKRLRKAEAVKVEEKAEAVKVEEKAEAAAPTTAVEAAAMAYKTLNAMTAAAVKAGAAAGQAAATPRVKVKTEQPQLPDASSGVAAPSLWWRKGRGRELGFGVWSKVPPLGGARARLLRLFSTTTP
jgi:hypothetical protein